VLAKLRHHPDSNHVFYILKKLVHTPGRGTAITWMYDQKFGNDRHFLERNIMQLRSWERTCDSSSDHERFMRGNTATLPTCSRPVHNFLAGGNGGSQLWQAQFTTPRPRFTTRFTAFGWETDLHDKTCRPTSIFGRHPFWDTILFRPTASAFSFFSPFIVLIATTTTTYVHTRRHHEALVRVRVRLVEGRAEKVGVAVRKYKR